MKRTPEDDWAEELTVAELDALRAAAELTLRLRWGVRVKIVEAEQPLRSALVKLDRLLIEVERRAALTSRPK